MKATAEVVKYAANLARIKVSDDELEKFINEFENIFGFVDLLSELDTANVEPTFHTMSLQNVFRDDVVTSNYDRELLLKNAPSQHDGCFEVPKVVE